MVPQKWEADILAKQNEMLRKETKFNFYTIW